MFKVNNKDTRTGVFIVNFEHISHLVLVFLLLTLLTFLINHNEEYRVELEIEKKMLSKENEVLIKGKELSEDH